uniref:Uncharacterized protein n=1 Tax=Setaria italica TaxID=4555 RepID=K3Y4L0_SETIT
MTRGMASDDATPPRSGEPTSGRLLLRGCRPHPPRDRARSPPPCRSRTRAAAGPARGRRVHVGDNQRRRQPPPSARR